MLRQAPLPLATLALQKEAITHLRMPGERMMKLAEELYQEGVISYPRTETDCFDPAYDLKVPRLQTTVGDACKTSAWVAPMRPHDVWPSLAVASEQSPSWRALPRPPLGVKP